MDERIDDNDTRLTSIVQHSNIFRVSLVSIRDDLVAGLLLIDCCG